MIPNVVKSAAPIRTVRYLVGPGRHEEHRDPHLVAGSELPMQVHGWGVLDADAAKELALWLDAPRRLHGVDMSVPVTAADPGTGNKIVVGSKQEYFWHCSLSLPPADGAIGDERWRTIAHEFADAMGLTDASGKAPVRWAAIHHGPNRNGNDHIHLVAGMVREDGTKWEGVWKDYVTAQKACRALEVRHDLTRVDGPAQGCRERGVKPVEHKRMEATGTVQTVPQELAARLRAAAVASTSEAEWIRRARADGVIIKPRWSKDNPNQVTGYKAALPPAATDGKWVFHAGGKLARDLSLPALRNGWQHTAGPQASVDALAEWQATAAGRVAVGVGGRETRALRPGAEAVAVEQLEAFNRHLTGLPADDRAGWARAARETSGVLSAWARHDPTNAPGLHRAARVLGRSAATGAGTSSEGSLMPAALVLTHGAAGHVQGPLGRELTRTVALIGRAHRAAANTSEATRIATGGIGPLKIALAAAGAVHAVGAGLDRIVDAREDLEPQTESGAGPGSGEQSRSMVHRAVPDRGRGRGR